MKPSRLGILILVSLALISCKGGGDCSFLEVKGRVQAISWSGGNGLTSGQWDLTRRGKISQGPWDSIKRDARGHVKKASVWFSDHETGEEAVTEIEFRTNRRGRIVKAVNCCAGAEFEFLLERTRKGELATVQLQEKSGNATYVYNYGNYVYDSKGNWTERRFTVTCGGRVTNSGVESRDIVYYE